ncbi:MAG: SDR family NAD(P)-dependent oxidoreductase [Chloroflexota bacterium]
MRFPDFGLAGRVAIVTGGSRGIGRAIALAMANAGADVAITGREQGPLGQTADEIRALGRQALTFAYDVSDVQASSAMVSEAVKTFGTIDILVNNVGTVVFAPAEEVTPEGWDRVFDVNLRGPFFCSRAVGQVMKAKGRGKIINIASGMGLRGCSNRVAYGTSKGGVIQMTRMLAVEWAPLGINVNCICPQLTRTEAVSHLIGDPVLYAEAVGRTPMGRIAEPEDIAGAAVFLASQAADFITGQILVVDGGRMATM